MKRIIGKQYLKKIKQITKFKAEYKCLICLSKNIYLDSAILKKEYLTCGCIRSNKTNEEYYNIEKNGKIISFGGFDLGGKNGFGYLSFGKKYIHRLVAEKYIPNPNNYTDVNHINGIKTDNRIENLEWCTRSYNLSHAYKTGLKDKKSKKQIWKSKLSNEEKNEIKNSIEKNNILAKKYNVSETTIGRIKGKKNLSVLQFDLNNNFIRKHKSAKNAAIFLNKKSSSHISAACRGDRKQALGFIWKKGKKNENT